ncbi:uncharacterized protein EV420DRAFT_1644425 [Desarmillaria tabescens]|uniref:Uncharacterized protein n=1 Tax=Armillaria tabescens TaxID=1929756 RepID=A0AA39N2K9_ARMTA|nr:uncharacterized protein EV420DRAFT_1644425 [Desarmillaria tabescens]KAK0455642.1 hypothetical protein EV420DRAFT_1644425 [Desarmillaria tabescens]
MLVSPPLDGPVGNGAAVGAVGPIMKTPYDPNGALDDIPGIAHTLGLFLASQMVESEEYCVKSGLNRNVCISVSDTALSNASRQ